MALEQFFFDNPIPCWVYAESTNQFIIVNKSAVTTYGYSETEFLEELKVNDLHTAGNIASHNGIWHHVDKSGKEFYVRIYSHDTLLNGQRCKYVMAVNADEEMREHFGENMRELRIAV